MAFFWTQINPFVDPSPGVVNNHAMSYAGPGKLLTWGGTRGASAVTDTWLLDGLAWTNLSPASQPGGFIGKFDHRMAWCGDGVLLFGGFGSGDLGVSGTQQDTWKFDLGLNDWTQLSPSTVPPDRSQHAMCWDGTQVVMFGGFQQTGGSPNPFFYLSDTWVWDGSDWTEIITASSPSDRTHPSVIETDSQTILYGGSMAATVYTDTWVFTGTDWIDLGTDATVMDTAAADSSGLQWDGVRLITRVSAGQTRGLVPSDNIWVDLAASPGAESFPHGAMASDGARLIIFGGLSGSPNGDVDNPGTDTDFITNQTWQFSEFEQPIPPSESYSIRATVGL